jgi:hypothetical protein
VSRFGIENLEAIQIFADSGGPISNQQSASPIECFSGRHRPIQNVVLVWVQSAVCQGIVMGDIKKKGGGGYQKEIILAYTQKKAKGHCDTLKRIIMFSIGRHE